MMRVHGLYLSGRPDTVTLEETSWTMPEEWVSILGRAGRDGLECQALGKIRVEGLREEEDAIGASEFGRLRGEPLATATGRGSVLRPTKTGPQQLVRLGFRWCAGLERRRCLRQYAVDFAPRPASSP